MDPAAHPAGLRLKGVRALWWTYRFWPAFGGGEILNRALARGLAGRGHALAVVTEDVPGHPPVDARDGIPIRRFPFHAALEARDPAATAEVIRGVRAIVAEVRPQLVHLHTLNHVAFFCRLALAGTGIPLLVTRHELFRGAPAPDSVPDRILAEADWIACCSRAALADVLRYAPAAAGRASAIVNGLAPPPGDPPPYPEGAPVLLGLGRLDRLKGFDLLIDAFARVRAARPEARLVVVGEGPERPALEARAAELGLGRSVSFEGWMAPDRVPAAIGGASIVVVPSRQVEAFGLVALQAAQLARPVIATRVGGLPEVVGRGGIVVEPEDPAGIARAALELLARPDEAARLGRRARERALTRFSAERYLNDYDALYRRLAR